MLWVPDGAPAVRQLKRRSEKRVFLDAERTDGDLGTAEGLQNQEWKNALITISSSPPSKHQNGLNGWLGGQHELTQEGICVQ